MNNIVNSIQQCLDDAIQPFCREWVQASNQHRGYPSPRYDEFVEAFLKTTLLTEVHKLTNTVEEYHLLLEEAKATSEMLTPDDVPSKIEDIYDLYAGCKSLVDTEVTTEFLADIPYSTVSDLTNNEAYTASIRRILLDARRCTYFWERVYQRTWERYLSWWRSQQTVTQHCFFTIIGEPQAEDHRKAMMNDLKGITHKYRLPADYGDEIESVIGYIVGVRSALPHAEFGNGWEEDAWQRMRAALKWVDTEGEMLIRNILQDLQKTVRDQHAKKRSPDVLTNKVYLDKDSYGQNVGDRLARDYPNALTDKIEALTPEMSQQQLNMAKAAFGKTGARVMEEWHKDPDATQTELAEKLGVSLSTVEKSIKRFREKKEVTKKIWDM